MISVLTPYDEDWSLGRLADDGVWGLSAELLSNNSNFADDDDDYDDGCTRRIYHPESVGEG